MWCHILNVFILWFVVAYSQKTLNVSWKDCTSANAIGSLTNAVFNPAEPQIGTNFTVVGFTTFNEDVVDGSYEIEIQEPILHPRHNGSLCEASFIRFPIDLGDVYYTGHSCPVRQGPCNIELAVYISQWAPTGQLTTYYRAYDKPDLGGNEIFCVEIISDIQRT
eukprot:UN07961